MDGTKFNLITAYVMKISILGIIQIIKYYEHKGNRKRIGRTINCCIIFKRYKFKDFFF